eukprot:gnl/Spiro4/6184_TR3177_c0_g1_i1.p1 gnl/Spiro4/6184_TR3177_c0_g1~~gnl/Spiro4/6184_TR3177_c0_g1_i1.p1  ORF type:complete len:237 (+),score=42.79 gnl/Spiro4/6184_TR3177_c0_g1_i1:34-711(+)
MKSGLVVLLVLCCAAGAFAQAPVSVGIYIEALCPGCQQWTTTTFKNTLAAIGGIMDVTWVPYGNAQGTYAGGGITCQHGEEECKGNMMESCVLFVAPKIAQWFPVMDCMEASGDPFTNAKSCVTQSGVNWTAVNQCYNGQQGKTLQDQAAAVTNNLQPPHQWTPWIVVAGAPLSDPDTLQSAVCAAYTGTKPAPCSSKAADSTNVLAPEHHTQVCMRDVTQSIRL